MRPSNDPLVLLHGLGMSPRAWDGVRPLLARRNDVVALALPGHRGGAAPGRRPVRVAALVDAVELALDELGLERPHIAGNSLGGWIAIELARRGRARTVCALAPAGSWTAGGAGQRSGARRIRRLVRSARLGGRIPWALRSPAVRRLALRDVAAHGERLRAQEAVEATRDLLACTVIDDVVTTPEAFAPLDPLPCPVTLAWPARDRVLPLDVNGAVARARLPGARFVVLDGAGHVPMVDDADAVARTVLETIAAASVVTR